MKTGIATASIFAATVLTANAQMPRIEVYPITSVTLKDPELLAGRRDGQPVTIAGELRIPRTKTEKLPAVVLLHGSAGIAAWMEDWSKELHQLGIASFVVDSFSGRGIVTTVNDQAQLGRLNMVVDAYRALDLLAKHPRIDPNRIAIMGFSRGGQAALYSAMNVLYETFGPANNLRFSAHVAFYPDCTTTYLKDGDVAGKPIRILIGTEDNYSSIDACRSYVDRLAKAGKDATLIEYQGAHHNFDVPVFKTPVVSRGAIVVRRCRLAEDSDHTIINRETQKPFTYNDACVGKDPTLAYDEAATNQARLFIREFLTQTLQ
ncbi:dienelactone hydrolase family protein [Bradyrhizobium glycinis]|uniref:dienelactone hydrolase family protein n=1 Tax=Bradyrhizobium glycinis TaxID=2751812 RepID=UPI0018D800FD|nr:dienelactone hydrolase family protein [Bradyrhizobium glycinis]MBH5371909.1 dienelactone hydrolase family protein [Bradyrhizobium glycinis]